MLLVLLAILIPLSRQTTRLPETDSSSYLFRLFDYHRMLTRFNKNTESRKVYSFDGGYDPNLYQSNRFRQRADENESKNKDEKELKNKTHLNEEDPDNGLSETLRAILKDVKKNDKKPFIPLHSIAAMSFNDKEQLKSQSCTTILQEDIDAI